MAIKDISKGTIIRTIMLVIVIINLILKEICVLWQLKDQQLKKQKQL